MEEPEGFLAGVRARSAQASEPQDVDLIDQEVLSR